MAGKEIQKKVKIVFQYISPEDIKSIQNGKPLLFILGLSAFLIIAINLFPKDFISLTVIVLFLSLAILLMVGSVMISIRNAQRMKRKISELTYTVVMDDSSIKMNRIAEQCSSVNEEWGNVISMKATRDSEVVTGFIGARVRVWYCGCIIQMKGKEPLVFNMIEKSILVKLHEVAKSHNLRLENVSYLES